MTKPTADFRDALAAMIERELDAGMAPLHAALDRIEIRLGAVNGAIAAYEAIAARKASR
ncbi:hypothetical protein [Thalassobaculum litoreum]|uniref:Uncharacterized protein n=1 Tax=Thalassobaculum litoreum DSM 18839 TaxID=1123362 RepID=A0A8G2BF26_9PROT|nr:hypothetical protein [Thalassobaculum litoreum]SDF15596.1 hypothetical protein SAMN05660686_00492 [Thalassobaculum litoreum DSM 18839]